VKINLKNLSLLVDFLRSLVALLIGGFWFFDGGGWFQSDVADDINALTEKLGHEGMSVGQVEAIRVFLSSFESSIYSFVTFRSGGVVFIFLGLFMFIQAWEKHKNKS
jgi:hypothetical protein